jgi:hypothetical protein
MKIRFSLMKKFSLYFQEVEKNNSKNCVLLRTNFLIKKNSKKKFELILKIKNLRIAIIIRFVCIMGLVFILLLYSYI